MNLLSSFLYKSECSSQFALLLLKFLTKTLKDRKPVEWSKIHHDNMCNLEHLNLLRDSLPLDGERSQVWLKKNKVIDGLHIKKHKRPECKTDYALSRVAADFPEADLMVREQTFCCLGRFKKF